MASMPSSSGKISQPHEIGIKIFSHMSPHSHFFSLRMATPSSAISSNEIKMLEYVTYHLSLMKYRRQARQYAYMLSSIIDKWMFAELIYDMKTHIPLRVVCRNAYSTLFRNIAKSHQKSDSYFKCRQIFLNVENKPQPKYYYWYRRCRLPYMIAANFLYWFQRQVEAFIFVIGRNFINNDPSIFFSSILAWKFHAA